jgi:uncharacterized protein (DUF302 family)
MNGLVTLRSTHDFATTVARLTAAVKAKGLTVFAAIDHAAGAAEAGMTLRPTTVVLFGSPKGGTPLMQEAQTASIDLPLKALVWQDAHGAVRITYNRPSWIAERHGLGASRVTTALDTVVKAVAEQAALTSS